MKKPKITIDDCFMQVRATTEALENKDATPEMIVEALVTIAVYAGEKSRRPEALFNAAIKWFEHAAYIAFEQAKKDKADKKAKRLGRTED